MKNGKCIYNHETCRFEPYHIRGRALRQQVLRFFMLSFLIALGGYFYCAGYFMSFEEMKLQDQNRALRISWIILHERIDEAKDKLSALIEKDDHNYRVILDSNPLPASIREAGTGGREKSDLELYRDFSYLIRDHQAVDKLKHQSDVELQSYEELDRILNAKILAWAARPAIQPISNTQLEHLHLTYGWRFHPIFKIIKDHKGLDFVADHGTPVYATGDGRVTMAYFSGSYGNVIFIDHGYNYETRYAHLSGYAVSPGQYIKRGQLIGYVGNTGNSVASHLHYEILFNGMHINPISFFQRDLSNEEYQKLISIDSDYGISLD